MWLATLLSFVVVTVAYALLTRHSWSTDPSFAFVDSECAYNLCHHCCWNGSHHMSWHLEQRLVPAPLFPSLLSCQPICLYLAFVQGTLIDRFQHFHFIFLPNMSYIYLFSICAGHSNWPRPVPEPLFHFSSQYFLSLSSLFSVCAGHLDRPVSTPVVWLEEQQSSPLHFNLARLYSLHHGSCHFDWHSISLVFSTSSFSSSLCYSWYHLPLRFLVSI